MRVPCQVAANLLTDDVLMRSYQLTPEYRPLVDLHSDLAPTQGNKGWFFGVLRCPPGKHSHLPGLQVRGAREWAAAGWKMDGS